MSIEELMKPRYKVIADYPNNPYPIGYLVEFSVTGTSFHCTTTKEYDQFREDIFEVENYVSIDKLPGWPHLFKKLEWWEEREEKDMPEFLKYNIDEENHIVRVYEWDMGKLFGYVDDDLTTGFDLILWHKEPYLPATKEEYEQYLQSKNSQP